MGVAFFVGVLVMDAMSGNPGNGPAFECEGAAERQEIFHPNWSFIAAMSEQPVIAHTDAEATGHAIEQHGERDAGPREHEQRRNGAQVESDHETGGGPVERLLKSSVFGEYAHSWPESSTLESFTANKT